MMNLFMVLLLFNFGIFCYGFNQNRIWNGNSAPKEKYPFAVRVHSLGQFYEENYNLSPTPSGLKGFPFTWLGLCAGTIISKRHILTAAICVGRTDEEPKQPAIIVDYDKLDLTFGNESTTYLRFADHGLSTVWHVPDKWNSSEELLHIHDIAIIEFPEHYDLKISPVLLAKNYVEGDNDIAIAAGYGNIDTTAVNFVHPTTLMEVNVPVIKDCAWKNDKDAKIICAGTKTHRPDQGDSGGPLLINRNDALYQIGIVQGGSYVNGSLAGPDSDFGMFTRVSAYCDWIEKVTNAEAKCVEIPPPIPAPGLVL